jgi:hypothetical protein
MLTGTILEASQMPIKDEYVSKTVTFVSQKGYTKDFPFRYDSIRVGDKYFDGEENVFEILSKELERNIWTVTNNLTGEVYERPIETEQNIIVKARMKLLKKENGLYYSQEYKVQPNIFIPVSTDDYFLENFTVRQVE